MINKKTFHITVVFSAMVFLILVITVFLTNLFIILLLRSGILTNPRPELILLVSALVSIIVGTIFSQVIGKRPLKFIQNIDNATKEVVKGTLLKMFLTNSRHLALPLKDMPPYCKIIL